MSLEPWDTGDTERNCIHVVSAVNCGSSQRLGGGFRRAMTSETKHAFGDIVCPVRPERSCITVPGVPILSK